MKPVSRRHVNKHKSSRRFANNTRKTKSVNLRLNPMRGGWRL